MNAIIYLLQVSACTGIFYGFYYLMLRRLTFFSINRWYLLVTLILSFGIPLLTITIRPDAAPIVREVVYVNNMQTYQTGQVSQEVIQPPINWVDAIKAIYFLAVTALLIKLIVMLASFFRRVKRKSIIRIGNVHVVYNADKLNNGSFLNYIFLNDDELSPDEIQQIIAHEMLHVKLFHSVDRILAKLAQIVLWFNPFAYLYIRAIEENHEFEVDLEIGQSNDKSKYADMLLHLSVARQGMLYNSFSVVPLKRRIAMLFNKPTNQMKKIIYLLALPMVILSCLAFAKLKNEHLSPKTSSKNPLKVSSKAAPDTGKAIVATVTKNNKVVGVMKFPATAETADTIKKKRKPAPPKPQKQVQPASTAKLAFKTEKAFLLARPAATEPGLRIIDEPFFERTHDVYADGKRKDKVTFHLSDGSASAQLGPDDKIGAFINGVFFDEDALRTLSLSETKMLTTTHEGFDAKKVPNGPYAVPFAFKTKTTQVIQQPGKSKPAAIPATPKKAFLLTKPAATNLGMRIEKQPFFSRTRIEDSEGKHDKITFKLTDITSTTNIDTDLKIGAFIDGVFYKETELNTLPSSKIAGLERSYEIIDVRKIPAGYHTSWRFKTIEVKDVATSLKLRGMTPKDIEALNRELSHYPQFYHRIKIGIDYDYVLCTLGKGLVSTPVKFNAKTGLLIDGVFYDEEAVKKLPNSTGKNLELWREGFDATKVPKDYIAAFTLRTKAAN